MKKGIYPAVLLFLLWSPAVFFGQSFGGSIEFKYYTLKDTTSNVYWVKGNRIKLDQYAKKSENIEGSFIFDLDKKVVNFVNPKRKVWGEQKSEIPPVMKGKCEITKTKNTKTVAGLKCTEYVVRNEEENTVISYWITVDNYNFFNPMMELWNRKDKQSVYYGKIKNLPKGSMPVLSEEKTISDNKFVTKLEMTRISKVDLDDSRLSIPEDYKRFEQ